MTDFYPLIDKAVARLEQNTVAARRVRRDALDRGLAVGCVGASEGAGGPKACFARRGRSPAAARSNSRQSSISERRCSSPIGPNVRKIARSDKIRPANYILDPVQ
jgi:hypothetical protein